MMGGSWLEPDSNVVGTEAVSVDDVVSARVRFFALPEVLGEIERRPNCGMGVRSAVQAPGVSEGGG